MQAQANIDERTLGDLLKDLTHEVQELLVTEVELAKVEVREEVEHVKDAGRSFGIAAATGILATFMLSFAAAWGLAEVMPTPLGFLIVGVIYAVIAYVCFVQAREKARKIDPVPEQTIATLKEDAQWARARAS